MARILVVEDDEILREGILFALAREGHQVRGAGSLAGMKEQLGQPVDLVVLDVSLPDGDSREFLPGLRESNPVPVIFLTARNTEGDMIAGFDAGADDYITKPFSLAVLRERVMAALRRGERRSSSGKASPVLREGPFTIDSENQSFFMGDREILLSRTEQKLLMVLIKNKNRILERDTLIEKVWGNDGEFVDENALSVTIKRLRDKLEKDPRKPEYIQTVYGIGYRFQINEGESQ